MTAFTDSRITESSSCAVSRTYDDIFYTNNDETTTPHIFAIRGSTGATVGSASISGETLVDPECLAIDRNAHLWLGDIGDNDGTRDYVRLFHRTEFGAKNVGSVGFSKIILEYEDGPRNAETLLIHPITNARYIISKESTSHLYKLPALQGGGFHNIMDRLSPTFGADVSDGAFTPDGRHVALRRAGQNDKVFFYDYEDNWSLVSTLTVTDSGQTKCEGISFDWDGAKFWTTSEGQYSTIHHISTPSFALTVPPVMPASPCG